MAKRILTVFSPRDELTQEIYRTLQEDIEEPNVNIDSVWTAVAAKQKILDGQDYDLIITHVNAPADSRSSDLQELEGLRLLQFMDEKGSKTPSILFSPSDTGEMLSITNEFSSKCYVLDLTRAESWKHKLIDRSKLALDYRYRHVYPQKEIKSVSLDISVSAEKERKTFWDVYFKVEGGRRVGPKPITIQVESHTIQRLLDWSQRLGELIEKGEKLWKGTLRDIGEELRTVLLSDGNFLAQFSELSGMVGGLEKFRIRFKVQRSAHPMILEALAERRGRKWDYWMLKAPIYRSVWTSRAVDIYQPPLFHGDAGPYNCLIIKSDIGNNYVSAIDKQFERLENIEGEVDFLSKLLSRHENHKVKIIPERTEICSKEIVEKWLKEKGPWHMVHYAGHSYFGKHKKKVEGKDVWTDRNEGLLFFPSEKEVVDVTCEDFSVWLRDAETRFVYLSSCRSSEEDFLYELADCGIPSAIGFRWDIKDELAKEHTKIFYTKLLERRSIEYAFLHTRRYMHDEYKDEIIWAAPVLIIQIPDDQG